MFTILIANLSVGIKNRYPFVEQLCRDYLCDEPPLFTVSATEEDIDKENAAVRRENRTDTDLPRGYLESIVLYREIAKQLPYYDAFVFHGVALSAPEGAYIFTARSGVGKTTHTRLWLDMYGDRCHILNGDKPILRQIDGVTYVFGSPWQGKENYGRNEVKPLSAIAFIHRAAQNRAERIENIADATFPFLGQAYVPNNAECALRVFAMADNVLRDTRLYNLYVNMDREAAEVAYEAITNKT